MDSNHHYDFREIERDSVLLEKIAVEAATIVPRSARLGMDPELLAEETVNGLVVRLRTHVLGEHLADKVVPVEFQRDVDFYFPATPWQHLKQRMPGWLLRWGPWRSEVRLERHTTYVFHRREVHLQQFALFPESPIRTPPDKRGPIEVRYERAWIG